VLGGVVVADTTSALRVLETSHPPGFYLPAAAFADRALVPAAGSSICEWKGQAAYLDVVGGGRTASRAAWSYRDPWPGFEAIAGHVSVYPAAMDEVRLDGEVVRGQEGGFYGGWITDEIVGPFKGPPGTRGW